MFQSPKNLLPVPLKKFTLGDHDYIITDVEAAIVEAAKAGEDSVAWTWHYRSPRPNEIYELLTHALEAAGWVVTRVDDAGLLIAIPR